VLEPESRAGGPDPGPSDQSSAPGDPRSPLSDSRDDADPLSGARHPGLAQTGTVDATGRDADGRSQRERMESGDRYVVDHEIVAMHRRAAALYEAFNATPDDDVVGRHRILDELFGAFGAGSELRAPFHCDYGVNIRIGQRVFVNFGLVALDVAAIVIGDDVQVGPNVQLLTPTHPVDPGLRRARWEAGEPITVGDNVWLGGGVIVLPGVTIGPDTVVGAGAVVTRDLPSGVVAVGNPARVIREVGPADGDGGRAHRSRV